jgi:hypothetical protein
MEQKVNLHKLTYRQLYLKVRKSPGQSADECFCGHPARGSSEEAEGCWKLEDGYPVAQGEALEGKWV